MTLFPDTRHSLLVRLRHRDDEQAWSEFVGAYRPLLHHLARRAGLQDADADEVVQETLLAVARAVDRWRADPNRGPFRAWLSRIARNLAVNMLTRTRRTGVGVGGSDFHRLLAESPSGNEADSRVARLEYRRGVFTWAAGQVRHEFRPATWRAFWETCVEGREIPAVAAEVGLSVGAVYIARSRVAARLREKVQRFENAAEEIEGVSP